MPDSKNGNELTRKWFLGTLEEEQLSKEKSKADKMFDDIITNSQIRQVSENHFKNKEYRSAVLDAMIQLEVMVKTKARFPKDDEGKEISGRSLMYKVFDPKKPLLKWSKLEHESEIDELAGYCHIMAGAMQGIRDPKAHAIFEQRPLRALQLVTLAALLADLVQFSEYVRQNE